MCAGNRISKIETFFHKLLKFSSKNIFCVAHNREKTDRVKRREFCPRGTKVDMPQGLILHLNSVYDAPIQFRGRK